MSYEEYSPRQIAERGEKLYREQIKDHMSEDDMGKFVVIDIETGLYEIDKEDLAATNRVLAKRPDAVLYGLRVGYPAAYRLGLRSVRAAR